jgi:serine/threonine protein kinase
MNPDLLGNDNAYWRFKNEIYILSRLKHPHIPELYEYDMGFQRPYLVMEYVEGPTYDHLIASGEMLKSDMATRLQSLSSLARTIAEMHEAGVIHRDIKPGNIKGIQRPYLLDFSVALHGDNSRDTRQDIGTAIYMPPDGPADALSDIYSFAIVAYEMLFGKHPIFAAVHLDKSVMEIRQMAGERHAKGQWSLPSRIPPDDLPADLWGADLAMLDSVFAKAFSKRELRYRSPVRFVNHLKQAILTTRNQPFIRGDAPPIPTTMPLENSQPMKPLTPVKTNHGLEKHRIRLPVQERWTTISLLAVFVFWFIVVLLLVFLSRPV